MSDYPMLISNKLHSFRNFTLQRYDFSNYLCNVLRDKVLEIVKKCLILVEIANLKKVYTRYRGQLIYCGLIVLCVYTGVWRYLTGMHEERQPTSYITL